MQAVKQFIKDCLWLLWMVFFRPRSFRREVERFNRKEKTDLIVKAILVTVVTPILLNLLIGSSLELAGTPFDFAKSLNGLTPGLLFGLAFGLVYGVGAGWGTE